MTKLIIGLLMAGALVVTGCDDKKADGGKDGKSGASGDSIGVAECDDYFKKAEECYGKTPATKDASMAALKATKDGWKTALAAPGGKESLKTSCKMMADTLAQTCK